MKDRPFTNLKIFHPKSKENPLLDSKRVNDYQKLMGMAQWLNSIGRMDIAFTTNQLSRFNVTPQEGHMKAVEHLYGFLKKWNHRSIVTHGKTHLPWIQDLKVKKLKVCSDMKEAYRDRLLEDLKDPPKAMGPPVKISIFVDATLASQKATVK